VNVDNKQVFDALLAQFGKISPALEEGVRSAYQDAAGKAAGGNGH
jgi:catalase